MRYAIVYSKCPSMVARDSKGGYYIYASKAKADEVCALLGPGHEVREWK